MRVSHNTQQTLTVRVHADSSTSGGTDAVGTMQVSKGALTVAGAEDNCCELCDCRTHLLLHSAPRCGARLVRVVSRDTGEEQARLELDGLWTRLSTLPSVRVNGLRALAAHMVKKHIPLPLGTAARILPLPCYVSLPHAQQRIADMGLPMDAGAVASEQRYMHDAFREVNHFNCKVISRASTAFAHMTLAQCRGVCLNACVLHQSGAGVLPDAPDSAWASDTHVLVAHTMQCVQVPAGLVRALRAHAVDAPVCQLRYLTADRQIVRTPVARLDAATLAALQPHVARPASGSPDTYVCVAACGAPILLGDLAPAEAPPVPEEALAAATWPAACARLRYIQAVCNHHRLSAAETASLSNRWAAAELARDPARQACIAALSRVRSPAVSAHAVIMDAVIMDAA